MNNRPTGDSTLLCRLSIPVFVGVLLLAGGVAIGQNIGQNIGQGTPGLAESSALPSACARSVLFNFPVVSRNGEDAQEVPIWQAPGNQAFFFVSGMTIDADGAPNAYHPDNIGLDDMANAGVPGHWDGIITDRTGEPLDPGPGRSLPWLLRLLHIAVGPDQGPHRSRAICGRLEDSLHRAAARCGRPGRRAAGRFRGGGEPAKRQVVLCDLRRRRHNGRRSIALANNLGIWSDARQGGRRGGILYLVFPGSGNRQPRTIEEISAETEKLLEDWGGAEKLTSCSANQAPAVAATATASNRPAVRRPSSAAKFANPCQRPMANASQLKHAHTTG